MRPVRLDMDGFASFRDKTVLDFTDADYFALVGATGAGKSTVIDAITFALYGTVPRWNDQRVITPALAPTAARGVVRLIFDADGQRYAVAREARRSGGRTSRVSMHASRLERLHDPDNLHGEGDVLAADSEVTKAVEDLLGLSYDHFTKCVALPQGEFAEFLHAKPSDRQDILSTLLGHQLYDELQSRANTLTREKRAAGEALEMTLTGYEDATEQHVSDLTGHANRLNDLQTWLTSTGLPNLEGGRADRYRHRRPSRRANRPAGGADRRPGTTRRRCPRCRPCRCHQNALRSDQASRRCKATDAQDQPEEVRASKPDMSSSHCASNGRNSPRSAPTFPPSKHT